MKKFLIGCGVLTGLAVILLAGTSIFAVRWFKENAPDLERLEQLENEMVERHGNPVEFTPPIDGDYSADRVRLYARIRQDLYTLSTPLREQIAAEIRGDGESTGGIRGWIKGIRKGAGYVQDSFAYLADADSVLLFHDMGRGEYVHFTGLLVRGFLAADPSEFIDSSASEEELSGFEEIAVALEEEHRRIVLDQWRNMLRAEVAEGEITAAIESWRSEVDQQLALARRDEIPWPFFGAEPPPSLTAVYAEVESTLRDTRPRNAGDLLLDDVLGAEMEQDGHGFQITFED